MADGNVVRSLEDLEVYQRAYRAALELHKHSLNFPRIEQFALADQLHRASKSICANIAEGFSRQRSSSADFHRFLVMALGSSDEMKVWLRFCAGARLRERGGLPAPARGVLDHRADASQFAREVEMSSFSDFRHPISESRAGSPSVSP